MAAAKYVVSLTEEAYPDTDKIRVVLDNLNLSRRIGDEATLEWQRNAARETIRWQFNAQGCASPPSLSLLFKFTVTEY